MSAPTSAVWLCAVPAAYWDDSSVAVTPEFSRLRPLTGDLLRLERRITKGSDLDADRIRHADAATALERLVWELAVPADNLRAFREVLQRKRFPSVVVGGAYFDLLEDMARRGEPIGAAAPGRLGAAVVPPGALARHLEIFRRAARRAGLHYEQAVLKRIQFLKWAAAQQCGVVEPHDAFSGEAGVARQNGVLCPKLPRLARLSWEFRRRWDGFFVPRFKPTAPIGEPEWLNYAEKADNPARQLEERLGRRIEQALSGGPPVALDNVRQEAITRVFQRYVARVKGKPTGVARLVYPDGSEARPFPFRCLAAMTDWRPTRILRVGLISMRHLDIDPNVDLYWYRNVDIPAGVSQAEADDYCFSVAISQFRELRALYPEDQLEIRLYHTGLESAVIGFYRALVESLASEPHGGWFRRTPAEWVRVRPVFHADTTGEKSGERWPA